MKTKLKTKKRNPQDATLRNVRAQKKEIVLLWNAIEGLRYRLHEVEKFLA